MKAKIAHPLRNEVFETAGLQKNLLCLFINTGLIASVCLFTIFVVATFAESKQIVLEDMVGMISVKFLEVLNYYLTEQIGDGIEAVIKHFLLIL